MSVLSIPLVRLPHSEGLPLPQHATPHSAGVDLMAAIMDPIVLNPLQRVLVPTGISISIPIGHEAQIRPRSGLALKHGLTVLNSPGTVDSDYRGEILVILVNLSSEPFTITRGMRIAQLVVAPVSSLHWHEVLHHHDATHHERIGGFGSTGL